LPAPTNLIHAARLPASASPLVPHRTREPTPSIRVSLLERSDRMCSRRSHPLLTVTHASQFPSCANCVT
jgi:hypothetical protein